jgi:DNA polymerase III gamma/tau subunit
MFVNRGHSPPNVSQQRAHDNNNDLVTATTIKQQHTHNTETNETTNRQHIDQTEKNVEKMLFLQKNTVIFIYNNLLVT